MAYGKTRHMTTPFVFGLQSNNRPFNIRGFVHKFVYKTKWRLPKTRTVLPNGSRAGIQRKKSHVVIGECRYTFRCEDGNKQWLHIHYHNYRHRPDGPSIIGDHGTIIFHKCGRTVLEYVMNDHIERCDESFGWMPNRISFGNSVSWLCKVWVGKRKCRYRICSYRRDGPSVIRGYREPSEDGYEDY